MTGSPNRPSKKAKQAQRKPIKRRKRKAIDEGCESDLESLKITSPIGIAEEIPKKSRMSFSEFLNSRSAWNADRQLSERRPITAPLMSINCVGCCSYSCSCLDRFIPIGFAEEIPKESQMSFREFYRSRSALNTNQLERTTPVSERQIIAPVEVPELEMSGSSKHHLEMFGGLTLSYAEDNLRPRNPATSPVPVNEIISLISMLAEAPSSNPLPQSPSPPPPPLQISPQVGNQRVIDALNFNCSQLPQLIESLAIEEVGKYKVKHKNDVPSEGGCTHSSNETTEVVIGRIRAYYNING